MRTPLIAACLSLATMATSAAAQSPAATTSTSPSFGILAGFNRANVRGDDADGDPRNGFFLGATGLFRFNSSVAFQPEVHYSQKGTRVSSDGIVGTIALAYLDVPLHLRFDFPSSGTVRPYLIGGPNVAVRVGCEVKGEGISVECDEIADFIGSEGDGFKRIDYGVSVGGGIDFPLAGKTATVTARYGYGLADLASSTTAGNRLLQFGFGVRF